MALKKMLNAIFRRYLLKLIFIEVQLLHNTVGFLVSTVQHSESAICIYMFISLLFGFPSKLGHNNGIEFPGLCSKFSLAKYFIHSINNVYLSIPVSQSIPSLVSPAWCPYVYSLHLCPISLLQITSSIAFFQIPHICINE